MLVQRNMAANCGLDFQAAAELVGCIAARELEALRQQAAGCCGSMAAPCAAPGFNLERALPVLEGLCAGMCPADCAAAASPACSAHEDAGAVAEVDAGRTNARGSAGCIDADALLKCADPGALHDMLHSLVREVRTALRHSVAVMASQ